MISWGYAKVFLLFLYYFPLYRGVIRAERPKRNYFLYRYYFICIFLLLQSFVYACEKLCRAFPFLLLFAAYIFFYGVENSKYNHKACVA